MSEKYIFFSTKKRKRAIDKTIAKILYHVLNGTEQELIDEYISSPFWSIEKEFGEIFSIPKNIEEIYGSAINYIKKVYDGYLTNKYTRNIMDNLK